MDNGGMKNTGVKLMVLAVLLAFVMGWCGRGRREEGGGLRDEGGGRRDTVVMVRVDTLWMTEVIRDTVTEVRYKTVLAAVADGPSNTTEAGTTVEAMTEAGDSVWVRLPFECHFAQLEDVADVWYSGYEARIDSARIYKRETVKMVDHFREVTKMPRMTLEVGVGLRYEGGGMREEVGSRRFEALGVGRLSWNCPKVTWSVMGAVAPSGMWCAGVGVSYRVNLVK